jgi:CheY-like chemotaxis protein
MGRSVVLIEDSDDHAELVRRALKLSSQRHELVRFEDGEQALSYLVSAPEAGSNLAKCAVILLDLSLPGVSGLEVLQALRGLDRTVCPVVVLTTSAGGEDIAAAYANGAKAYVVKPVDLKSFRELVQDLTNFWVKWNKLPAYP